MTGTYQTDFNLCERDNGANLKAVVQHYSDWYDVSCFAHTQQFAVYDTLNKSDGINDMLAKCRMIVGHYHHSGILMKRIHALQKETHLYEFNFITSCPTR